MAVEQRRAVTCRVCGNLEIRAAYRADDAVYLECPKCGAMWPISGRASEERPADVPVRIKSEHNPRVH
jgi:uncharacterized Zn finger protein